MLHLPVTWLSLLLGMCDNRGERVFDWNRICLFWSRFDAYLFTRRRTLLTKDSRSDDDLKSLKLNPSKALQVFTFTWLPLYQLLEMYFGKVWGLPGHWTRVIDRHHFDSSDANDAPASDLLNLKKFECCLNLITWLVLSNQLLSHPWCYQTRAVCNVSDNLWCFNWILPLKWVIPVG